jgi:hypothetical protein
MGVHIHIHITLHACCLRTYVSQMNNCIHMYIYIHICTHNQDFVLAFMMGTQKRLGCSSRVLLIDPGVATMIGRMVVDDKWLVKPKYMYISANNSLLLDNCVVITIGGSLQTHVCVVCI